MFIVAKDTSSLWLCATHHMKDQQREQPEHVEDNKLDLIN